MSRRRECYRPRSDPHRGRAAASGGRHGDLYGNLAPDGAVIKQTAASPRAAAASRAARTCSRTTSRCAPRSTARTCRSTEYTVLVMKNCGPKGAPGFPEWGHIPMPKVLLEQGVTDMVRISDARMSGTSFGTVVLHVAPESAIGGRWRWCRPATRFSSTWRAGRSSYACRRRRSSAGWSEFHTRASEV